jgi:hypothetical protein
VTARTTEKQRVKQLLEDAQIKTRGLQHTEIMAAFTS